MTTFQAVRTALAVAAGLALTACGPTRNAALEDARAAYDRAAGDPEVARYAPVELNEAREAVYEAQLEWHDDQDVDETDHLSYVATRKVQVAEAHARAEMARRRTELYERTAPAVPAQPPAVRRPVPSEQIAPDDTRPGLR